MKYLITESQYKIIKENEFPIWLRRRLSDSKSFEDFIFNAEVEFPNPCDDFEDEFGFADNVITRAVDDFLTRDEDLLIFIADNYDDIHEMVFDVVKEWFGEYLIEIYYNTCNETDEI